MRAIEKQSPCKVNLLLNILGKRPDGFHELESVMHPVRVYDRITFERGGQGLQLSCSRPELPTDSQNLVHRAAERFLETSGITEGVRLYLEKHLPLAGGLGGGSANAAVTLLGLNELFGNPLTHEQLTTIAGSLGSDVPFFLQAQPALATGRGERIEPLAPFPAMRGAVLLLIHPGFGIATPWAYQQLARFPAAVNGRPGRAKALISALKSKNLREAGAEFYNALEAPALEKFPVLALFQKFLRNNGAEATLMSGSGSTTFALVHGREAAEQLLERFKGKFGVRNWTAMAQVL